MALSRCPVWLICGGQSPEHEISFSSGRTAAANVDHARYALFPVYIRRDGLWALADEPLGPRADKEEVEARFAALSAEGGHVPAAPIELLTAGQAASKARRQGVEAVLLILHGALGEDGTIQGMLEMEGLSYAGSGVLASALAMDKSRCQCYLKACGLPTPPCVAEEGPFDAEGLARFAQRAEREAGIPCVVKPSRAGSSVGIAIVRDRAQLPEAIQAASAIDPLVMVERYEKGEETTCAVLEVVKEGRRIRRAMPVTAIRPKHSEFFDYQAKYTPGECDEITPAPISAAASKRIQELAVQAFEALGCRDMARVDFILSSQGPVILEINTIPGLTPTSLLPQGAAHGGISFPALLDLLIENARARRPTKPN